MAQQIEEEQRQNNDIINNLQGAWVWIDDYNDMWSMIVFDGNNMTEYNDAELSGYYTIRDIDKDAGKIYYENGSFFEYDVTNDGRFRLFGDKRRGMRFSKLSSRQENAYVQYCKHIKDWKETYNEYLNVNVYGAYSRKQASEDLKGIIGLLNNDLDKMGNNNVCKKQVKGLWNITSGLTPF